MREQRGPGGLEEVQRGEIEATFDEIKSRECNSQHLFYDLVAPSDPPEMLRRLAGHLTTHGWTVTGVDDEALGATKRLTPGLQARLQANWIPEERNVHVGGRPATGRGMSCGDMSGRRPR